jgi:8-oxo-dGTP pyrophosphatase MutT (NUDIX family)
MNTDSHPFEPTITRLRAAMQHALPGLSAAMRMAPQNPNHQSVAAARERGSREGAVLILLYPHENELYLVLTVRSSLLRTHSGQISLPGGRIESGESAMDTALRETEEELGIPTTDIEVLGALTEVYIPPSNYCLAPFVGVIATRPAFQPNAEEVAALIELPVRHLLDTTNHFVEEWMIEGAARQIPYFGFNDYKIWGATAIILSEFVVLWEQSESLRLNHQDDSVKD